MYIYITRMATRLELKEFTEKSGQFFYEKVRRIHEKPSKSGKKYFVLQMS